MVVTMNRRQMMFSSATIVGMPLAEAFMPVQARAQSSPAAKTLKLQINPDLTSYLHDGLSSTVKVFRSSNIEPIHLHQLADKIGMLAHHIAATDLDATAKAVVGQLDASQVQGGSSPAFSDETLRILQLHNPEMTADDVPAVPMNPENLQASIKYIAEYGISGHFLNVADALRSAAGQFQQKSSVNLGDATAAPVSYLDGLGHPTPHLRYADLSDDDHAHLVRICEGGEPKPKHWFCSKLALWGNYGLSGALLALGIACLPPALAAITVALPGIGIALDAACAAIAANPWAAAYAISSVLSYLLSGIQTALC